MSPEANAIHALGFRVKSGKAIAVLVAGPVQAPRVLDRRVIELCDPAIPESRQPYHAAMGTLETDEAKVDRRRRVVAEAANRSITQLLEDCRNAGHQVQTAGLVVGSDIDPVRITNPHIRAHALEGRLFRTVVEEAVRSEGLACSTIVERSAYTQAAALLKRSEQELKSMVAKLGKELGGPWRADEKMACLAAWLALG